MSLLFALAGAATCLAFRHRGAGHYAGERVKRLLIPFFFGLLVIVPPQSWLAYITHHDSDISYWDYLPRFFTTGGIDGTGYEGGFTMGHMWFVIFLFVYSLVALPLFVWLRNRGGRRILSGFGRLSQIPALLVLVPALVLMLPWLENDDDMSGQPPFGFFFVIVLGFMLVGDERVVRAIDRHWRWMLTLGVVASVVYIVLEPRTDEMYVTIKVLYEVGVWSMILGLLGLFHRFVNRTNRVYGYATEAAYPFYILHQTVLVAVAYFVVQWSWPGWARYTLIAVASFTLSLGIYEVAVRRWNPVRFLFGMKPRRQPVAAAEPRVEPARE